VSPTTANFVHTAHDLGDALAANGVLARRLGGALGTRISIGTEAECRAAVEALGGTLAEPTPVAPAPLLVLDIDGVMIDAEASFREAVRLALSEMRPGLAWDDRYFRAMKRLGGMNNDFRLCAGVAALEDRGQLASLLEGRVTWNDALEAALSELFAESAARVAHHYEHTRACEVPLVTLAELEALGAPFAILTGRDPRELRDAMSTLGFSCEAVCAHAPHVEKPRPGGLLQLADAFRATHVVFVGDTRDDRAALDAAAKLRPETHFRFAAVGPDRDSFARPEEGDRVAATLRDLLAQGPLFPDDPRSPA
jgi:phosphoglycolate phosphatase-like HAD superfamily hydrolase